MEGTTDNNRYYKMGYDDGYRMGLTEGLRLAHKIVSLAPGGSMTVQCATEEDAKNLVELFRRSDVTAAKREPKGPPTTHARMPYFEGKETRK
jgi:hypothetical protein